MWPINVLQSISFTALVSSSHKCATVHMIWEHFDMCSQVCHENIPLNPSLVFLLCHVVICIIHEEKHINLMYFIYIYTYMHMQQTMLLLLTALFMIRNSGFLSSVPAEYESDFLDPNPIACHKLEYLKSMLQQRLVMVFLSLNLWNAQTWRGEREPCNCSVKPHLRMYSVYLFSFVDSCSILRVCFEHYVLLYVLWAFQESRSWVVQIINENLNHILIWKIFYRYLSFSTGWQSSLVRRGICWNRWGWQSRVQWAAGELFKEGKTSKWPR